MTYAWAHFFSDTASIAKLLHCICEPTLYNFVASNCLLVCCSAFVLTHKSELQGPLLLHLNSMSISLLSKHKFERHPRLGQRRCKSEPDPTPLVKLLMPTFWVNTPFPHCRSSPAHAAIFSTTLKSKVLRLQLQ